MKQIPTLSLFSGAGGLDIGFHDALFDILACVEIEEAYCKTLRANIGPGRHFGPRTEVICKDIREFDPTPYTDKGIECVIGGPPCQTFSAAGRRSGGVIGTNDARGQLFRAYCEILIAIRPKVFVFENVYGLPGANGGKPWKEILAAFSAIGYRLRAEVIDSADYGVPQHRERLFMVGFKEGKFEFPLPTHGPDSPLGERLVSVLDALSDIQDESEPYHDGLGGLYGHLLPLVPEGLNYSFFTAEMGHPEPQFAWRSKFHDLLYKVNRHEPCRTIKAQPGKFTGPLHWKNRNFHVEELKRLQTFPDSYELIGSYGRIVEQIGNSVPPRLAQVLAHSVREQLLAPAAKLTFPVRPIGFKSTFRQRQRERSAKFKEIAAAEIRHRYPNKMGQISQDPKSEKYFVCANGLFDRRKYKDKPKPKPETDVYKVVVRDKGRHIDVSFEALDKNVEKLIPGDVRISGLSKYLGRIQSATVTARICTHKDIFAMWAVIEEVFVERSRFFSLIDIYGHYANRGDTVQVTSKYEFDGFNPLDRAINYFSNTDACGGFVPITSITQLLRVSETEFRDVINDLRAIRFDIRTDKTHPIIGVDRVICTYPFPLLSQKALVQSKVELTNATMAQAALI